MPQKADFLGPYKLQKNTKEGKRKEKREREGRKEEKRKKRNGCTLGFYNGYFEDSFCPKKKLFDAKGPFGGNVFKNLYVFHFLSFFIFKTEFFGTIKGDDQEIQIIE